jgi:hypothetical protein
MKEAILCLRRNETVRTSYGERAREHILRLADPEASTSRLLAAVECAIKGHDNPYAVDDLGIAVRSAEYLDSHQWGETISDSLNLYANFSINKLRRLWHAYKHRACS